MKIIKTIEDDQGRHWKLVQQGEYIYLKNHFTYCVGRGNRLFGKVLDSVCEYWGIHFEDTSLDGHSGADNFSTVDNIIALTMSDGANIRHGGWIIGVSKKDNHIFAKNEYNTRYHRIGHFGNGIVVFYPEARKIDIYPGVFIKGKEMK